MFLKDFLRTFLKIIKTIRIYIQGAIDTNIFCIHNKFPKYYSNQAQYKERVCKNNLSIKFMLNYRGFLLCFYKFKITADR